MENNMSVRAEGILNSVDRKIEDVRLMSDEQIKEFEEELKKQTLIVKERIDLVGLLSGREISDKAFDHLKEVNREEFYRAIEEGATFESKPVPYYNIKTKKMETRIVYYCPQAIMAGQATDKIASAEKMLVIKFGLNNYEKRRAKSMAKRDALNSVKKVIKRINCEKKEDKFKAELSAKKIKVESVVALGKKLMESMQKQEITPEIRV